VATLLVPALGLRARPSCVATLLVPALVLRAWPPG